MLHAKKKKKRRDLGQKATGIAKEKGQVLHVLTVTGAPHFDQ